MSVSRKLVEKINRLYGQFGIEDKENRYIENLTIIKNVFEIPLNVETKNKLLNYFPETYLDILKGSKYLPAEIYYRNDYVESLTAIYDALCYICTIILKEPELGRTQEYKNLIEELTGIALDDLFKITDEGLLQDDHENVKAAYLQSLTIVCFLYNNFTYYKVKEECPLLVNPVAKAIALFDVDKLRNIKERLKQVAYIDAYLFLSEILRNIGYEYEPLEIDLGKCMWTCNGQDSLIELTSVYYVNGTHFLAMNYLVMLKDVLEHQCKKDNNFKFTLTRLIIKFQSNYLNIISKYGNCEDLQRFYEFILFISPPQDLEVAYYTVMSETKKLDDKELTIKYDPIELLKRILCLYFVKEIKQIEKADSWENMVEKIFKKVVQKVNKARRIRKYMETIISTDNLLAYVHDICVNMDDYSVASQNLRNIFKRDVFNNIKLCLKDLLKFYWDLRSKCALKQQDYADLKKNNKKIEIIKRRRFFTNLYEVFTLIGSLILTESNTEIDIIEAYQQTFQIEAMLSDLKLSAQHETAFIEDLPLSLNICCHLHNYFTILLRHNIAGGKNMIEQINQTFENFGLDELEKIGINVAKLPEIDTYLIFSDLLRFCQSTLVSDEFPKFDQQNYVKFSKVSYFDRPKWNETLEYSLLHSTHFLATTFLNILTIVNEDLILHIALESKDMIESIMKLMSNPKEKEIYELYNLISNTCFFRGLTRESRLSNNKIGICRKFLYKLEDLHKDRERYGNNVHESLRYLIMNLRRDEEWESIDQPTTTCTGGRANCNIS